MDDNIGLERDSDTLNNLYSLLLACLANSEMDFVGSFNQIEKNISKIVSLEKIENMTNFGTISREDREYREVALIADSVCTNHRLSAVRNNYYPTYQIVKKKIESFSSRFSIFYDLLSEDYSLVHGHPPRNRRQSL